MDYFQINKKLLPMKIHFFLKFGGNAGIFSFFSTISKQRGYSAFVVGLMLTILPLPGLIIRPIFGAITDKYKCRKVAFVTCLAIKCMSLCVLLFIPGMSAQEEIDDATLIKSPLFWLFSSTFLVLKLVGMVVIDTEDTICLGLLGNDKHKFGEQRVWGAIGYGTMSAISGFCVDLYSKGQKDKDYTPGFMISLILFLIDIYVATKLEDVQKKHTSPVSDVKKLMFNMKIMIFFLCVVCFGIIFSIPHYYEFWYLEDITNMYHPETKSWIKTLQGLTLTVQCFGGEVPFFLLSSFILKRVDHITVFSVMFFAFFVRFFMYSIIQNPVWVLPVELFNGLTYAIPYAAAISYAAHISPVGTEGTLQGFVGTFFSGIGWPIGSFIGGFMFKRLGSISTFKILSIGALVACVTHIIVNYLLSRWSKNNDNRGKYDEVSLKTKTEETNF